MVGVFVYVADCTLAAGGLGNATKKLAEMTPPIPYQLSVMGAEEAIPQNAMMRATVNEDEPPWLFRVKEPGEFNGPNEPCLLKSDSRRGTQ